MGADGVHWEATCADRSFSRWRASLSNRSFDLYLNLVLRTAALNKRCTFLVLSGEQTGTLYPHRVLQCHWNDCHVPRKMLEFVVFPPFLL